MFKATVQYFSPGAVLFQIFFKDNLNNELVKPNFSPAESDFRWTVSNEKNLSIANVVVVFVGLKTQLEIIFKHRYTL